MVACPGSTDTARCHCGVGRFGRARFLCGGSLSSGLCVAGSVKQASARGWSAHAGWVGIALPAEQEINNQVLQRKGVPHEHNRVIGAGSRSTFEDVLAVRGAVAGKWLRIMVVTSP